MVPRAEIKLRRPICTNRKLSYLDPMILFASCHVHLKQTVQVQVQQLSDVPPCPPRLRIRLTSHRPISACGNGRRCSLLAAHLVLDLGDDFGRGDVRTVLDEHGHSAGGVQF